jgi:valyl-tRNA synthetase
MSTSSAEAASSPQSPQELSKAYSPQDIEKRWYQYWLEGGYFHARAEDPRPPYTIVIPPPNVTGALHVGHGLVNTLQDVLIRWARMRGMAALWIPGTDHAGIATQHVVVEHLRARGIDRHELGREGFLQHAWEWKEQYGGRIIQQLKHLGCSCDWQREVFTLDEPRQRAVRVAFKRLYDKGLIYRGQYLINWDPVDLTALADDEVEYEDEKGHLWHIRYPFEDGSGHAVVATTRPETMLGDTAVAVNPTDERYQHLIGKYILLPLVNRRIPIIADDFVKKDFGTGMVKVTPAHDPNDFQMGLRHHLEMINILTDNARINENGGSYCGMDRYDARNKVVEDLKAQGLLVKVEPHEHRVGRGYRSKSIIEPRLSRQWFVRIEPLADQARKAVRDKRTRIIPPTWENTYFAWMDNVRDWCISRQLWWGHRIPIWYSKADPERMICHDGEGVPPEVAAAPDAWRQDPDVLDTWFSSALWPFSTLGWPEDTPELRKFYPTTVLVTAHDILFFWVARMIMMGLEFKNEVPFHDVFLHGLIFGKTYYERRGGDLNLLRDAARKHELDRVPQLPPGIEYRWEKMSKSKANVIDPLEMIEDYGADATRLTLTAYAAQGRNIDLDYNRFEGYRNFVNKLWNAARFALMTAADLTPAQMARGISRDALQVEDRWILSLLARTRKTAHEALEQYQFDQYVGSLYQFTWHQFCDWYLELVKPRLYAKPEQAADSATAAALAESRGTAQWIVCHVLDSLLRLFHPVIPFVTEEIHQTLRARFDNVASATPSSDTFLAQDFSASSLCVAAWPLHPGEAWMDPEAEFEMNVLQAVVTTVRNLRAETGIAPGTKTDVFLTAQEPQRLAQLHRAERLLRATLNLGALHVSDHLEPHGQASVAVVESVTVHVLLPPELLAQEKARLEKEIQRLAKDIPAREAKLANPKFTDRAPREVVEAERQRLEQAREQIATLRAKLDTFA